MDNETLMAVRNLTFIVVFGLIPLGIWIWKKVR